MFDTRSEKNKLREKYKSLREALPSYEKQRLDEKICNRFLSLVTYRFADTVLMYAPIKGEINVDPIALAALKAGKRVAYPRCIPEKSEMFFHYINSLDDLKTGYYSIREPDESAPVFDPTAVKSREECVCIIPALVYDKHGFRIGYGKGYYDRYLSHFKGTKAGIIYANCIEDSIVHGRYDLTVDFILSERGVNIIK